MCTYSWGQGPGACGARRPCRAACRSREGVGAEPVAHFFINKGLEVYSDQDGSA